MDFVHLHVHSNYSLLQGTFSVQQLIRAAGAAGMTAVALTDTNGLYGAIEFYEAARAADIKPIIGTEIVWGAEQCVLLAANRQGYANLCRIVTERRLAGTPHYDGFLRSARRTVDKSQWEPAGDPDPGPAIRAAAPSANLQSSIFDLVSSIAADPRGLFALTATPSLLGRLKGVVPDGRLFAEMRADEANSFEPRCPALCADNGPRNDGIRVNIADTADRCAIPVVGTVNVNFLASEHRQTHAVLSAIRENVALKDLLADGRMLAGAESWFQPAERAAARLPGPVRKQAMRNALRIAEECNLEIELGVPRLPRADLRPGERPDKRLREMARAGARQRYGRIGREVRERLQRELRVIEQLDFCDYFLVVSDIVAFARREGIPHVGRGSAANSIVSYCLGISAVDPLKLDLYFERFLNEFRTDVPDIDIDFCWRQRDDVINYVYKRYGDGRVAMISTHTRLLAKSAFRDVARVMGLPQEEIDRHSKKLPCYGVSSIREAMETFPEMADFPIGKEPWRSVVATALRIDGYVRHLSVHLGGLVIGDRPLTWYTALENSAKGIVVTQYEMDSIQRTGLVKIDLLGQRSLSIVAEAARSVEEQRGIRVDLDHLPDRDPRTAVLLRNGRTMGCFQIESPGMRQLLQMFRAESITDLIQGLSLIRPGPSSSGMKHAFIRRRRGEEPVSYPSPLLEEVLSKTYGVMLYQEDILRVAQAVAGFTLAEGDELRKYTSKQRSREKLREFRERFVRGAVGQSVDPTVAEDIWRQIESFAAYSYCKAHACTYGHIAYQASYLKAHWPAQFLAAVIANKAGFYDPRTYLAEARRFNVHVLPPCVNRSDIETRAEPHPVFRTPRSAFGLRPGLEFVKLLARSTIKQILQERTIRPFTSLEVFCARVRLTRPELANLILCGAFDSFGLTRPTLMLKAKRRKGYSALRGPHSALVLNLPPHPLRARVLWELQILGFSHSGHPLDAWEPSPEGRSLPAGRVADQNSEFGAPAPLVYSFALRRHAGRRVAVVGWLVTTRRAVTKSHEYMKFLTLEDRHGVVEAVLFPDVYRQCGARLGAAGCYQVTGTVKEQHGAFSLVADQVEPLPLK